MIIVAASTVGAQNYIVVAFNRAKIAQFDAMNVVAWLWSLTVKTIQREGGEWRKFSELGIIIVLVLALSSL